MAILFNSHLCKHWILYEDRDSLCPITTKALAFWEKLQENNIIRLSNMVVRSFGFLR